MVHYIRDILMYSSQTEIFLKCAVHFVQFPSTTEHSVLKRIQVWNLCIQDPKPSQVEFSSQSNPADSSTVQ